MSLIVRTGKQQTGPASQRRTRSEDEKHSFCDDDGETLFQRRGTSKRNKQTEGGGTSTGTKLDEAIYSPLPPSPSPFTGHGISTHRHRLCSARGSHPPPQ